jgi:hypothetical protein
MQRQPASPEISSGVDKRRTLNYADEVRSCVYFITAFRVRAVCDDFHYSEELTVKTLTAISFVIGILAAYTAMPTSRANAAESPPSAKVYELRIYHANPGKLEALHARFRDHTCKLFQKHGIELIGFWTPIQGEEAKNTLYYVIAFPSVEAQKKAWQAFRDDPDWKKVKDESEKGGVLVNKVDSTTLKATDYSPLH